MPARLVDRSPHLSADELAAHFVPPPRFAGVRFDTFAPNPDHPSQAAARADLEKLVTSLGRFVPGAPPGTGGGDAAGDAGPTRSRISDAAAESAWACAR